jgi:hypothetical protein
VGKLREREGGDDLLGFEGDGDDLADEAEDLALVILAVGVVSDTGAWVSGYAVLVDYPFEDRAVAEVVVEGGGCACPEIFVWFSVGSVGFGEAHGVFSDALALD